jgi:hypothetical protein
MVTSQVEYDLDTGEVLFFNNTIEDITERKQREREQNAIVAVASALRGALTRAETLTIILDQIIQLMEAETALVATCTDASSEVVLELARGFQCRQLTGLRTQPADSITGRVIASGQPYLNNEARPHTGAAARRPDPQCACGRFGAAGDRRQEYWCADHRQ